MDEQEVARAVDALMDEYRATCLWFLRPDYYPATDEERLSVLSKIERHADREGFRKAARLREWLSPRSSATSAVS